MNSYITILILTYLIFLSGCKSRECEIPDAPPFTEDQLSWIDSTSYNYRVTYQGNIDTIRSNHTNHKIYNDKRWGTGVRCEQAIRYYTGYDTWNLNFPTGGGLENPVIITSKEYFSVHLGSVNQTLTFDPRNDTATISGVLYSKVYKYIDSTKKVYFSRTHGLIYSEGLKSGLKAEILPQQN
jgi:hypothetical protein